MIFKKFSIRKKLICLVTTAVLMSNSIVTFALNKPITRPEADEKYKWDLTELYKSNDAFFEKIDELRADIEEIMNYSGKLNTAEDILEIVTVEQNFIIECSKLQSYAQLLLDLDQSSEKAQEAMSLVENIMSYAPMALESQMEKIKQLSEKDIINIKKSKIYKENKELFDVLFEEISDEDSECDEMQEVMSGLSSITNSFYDAYQKLSYADKTKTLIKNKDYYEELDEEKCNEMILSKDSKAIEKLWKAFNSKDGERINTYASLLISEIKKNNLLAKLNGFETSLDSALASEGVSREIYENLLKTTDENLEAVHKLVNFKNSLTGLKEVHLYDSMLAASDISYKEKEYTFEEAVQLIKKALKPLGEEYIKKFQSSIEERWVDVYADENKNTGAYAANVYEVHPYVLMNFDGSLDSVLTLAHEMGHALHYLYTNENQSYENSDIPIFTAEVASTCNELLVMDYLIKNAQSDNEKLYLVNKQIDTIQNTFFTQVMYAEFEKELYDMIESGQAVSTEKINQVWLSLLKKYDGGNTIIDEEAKYGWIHIHHFYENFYVYKYATSISASYKLAGAIIAGKKDSVNKYIEFLSAGGVNGPVETLKNAGVDMENPETINNLINYYGELVHEYINLYNKLSEKAEKAA